MILSIVYHESVFHQQQNVNTLFSIELQKSMLIVLPHQVPKYPCSLFFSFFFFFGSTYKFNPKTDGVVGPMKLHQFSRYRQSNHREPVTEKYITDFYKCLYEHNNNNNNQYTISLFLDITTLWNSILFHCNLNGTKLWFILFNKLCSSESKNWQWTFQRQH